MQKKLLSLPLVDAIAMLDDLRSGTITPAEGVHNALSKIEESDAEFNATAEILRDEAEHQLRDLPEGSLKGLPVSVKECYAIAGKKITSGSQRMPPIACNEDAAVVRKLRDAGAVIVARGNTSEFLLGRETDNLVFGTTKNAINPALTAGGSSGGDASMVARGCVAFGVGTDLGGSIRYPATFNGIVGFKPASGQIDKTGIFPVAGNAYTETMNSPSILSRSVRDARLIYNVISGAPLRASGDMDGIKIYTSRHFRMAVKDRSISDALEAAVNFFGTHSFSTDDLEIPEAGALFKYFNTLIFGGFTDKVYEWSRTARGERLSYFSEFVRRLQRRPTLSDELFALLLPFNLFKPSASKLRQTIETVEALRTKYHSLLGADGILVLPTLGILAPLHKRFYPQYNKPGIIDIITPVSFSNVLNLSCITLPAWKFQKSPNVNPPGIQLIAAPGSERLLLDVAERLEVELR